MSQIERVKVRHRTEVFMQERSALVRLNTLQVELKKITQVIPGQSGAGDKLFLTH